MDSNIDSQAIKEGKVKKLFRNLGGRKKLVILAVLLIVLGYLLKATFLQSSPQKANLSSPSVKAQTVADKRAEVPPAKKSQSLGKEFSFEIKDGTGKVVSNLKYFLDNVEIRDEIIVKGEKATAVYGRSFLIINLKLKNEHNQSVSINTRNYIRLSVNGNEEWLAPEVHNDPVEVQAISTKLTRLGFPISDTDSNLKLQIGEITGEKTILDLNPI